MQLPVGSIISFCPDRNVVMILFVLYCTALQYSVLDHVAPTPRVALPYS
jgi:hypothetical protein